LPNNDHLAALQHELHVWIAHVDDIAPEQLRQQCYPLLDEEEKARHQRFHFEHDRHHYLAAHVLLRIALSRYLPISPALWRFVRGSHGKPQIDPALKLPPLQFNLSHTRGMVACVIAADRNCGIDVECIRPMNDMQSVAATVFSESEIAFLAAQPDTTQASCFFMLWTLKEAYIKATGLGMSLPLKRISFDIQAAQISVTDASQSIDDSHGWLFDYHLADPMHPLALAVQPTNGLRKIVYHKLDLVSLKSSRLRHQELATTGL
jgi:4'-phosphopantetheinyl transferase